MNTLKHNWVYCLLGFIVIVISNYYLYSNRNNPNEIVANKDSVAEIVHTEESAILEWVTYAHPSLGYRIDYPKNDLPVISFGTTTSSVLTFFSSDPTTGSGGIVVSLSKAEGETVFDHNKKRFLDSEYAQIDPPTISFKNAPISDSKIEAYFVTVSAQDYSSESLQFSFGGIYYDIGFSRLPQSIIDRVAKSFSIDFVPEDLKLF